VCVCVYVCIVYIGTADFEGARAWVIKAADALQRCEMADHQAIVLRMLSQVNSAEEVHRARMQAQELLSEAEAALAKEDEPAARRALDAAQRAVDSIGDDAQEPDMRERFAKLQQVLGARDEASRCTAVASKALSAVEQLLASDEVEQARQSLTAAGEAVEEASSAAKGRPDLADQVLELRARHARLSECLERGGNRAVARKLAGQHHAAAQRAINVEDTETAAEELACARHQYNVAGDLDSMGEVLDALLQQVEDLRKKLSSDKERKIGDEAIKKFGEVVVQGDFELARSLLDQARAHYETAKVDMSAVLNKLESKLRAAEANAAKHSVGDESLQLAIEQVAVGNLEDAREALNIAKKAYKAAGIELMDDAIRELEADIDAELAQRAEQDSATHAPPADASQVDDSSDSSSSHSDEESAEQPAAKQASAEPKVTANGAAGADKKKSGKERYREGEHLWRKAFDPASGDVYYYHTGTKVTQWDRPEEYDSEDDWESSSWGGSERPPDKDEDSFRSALSLSLSPLSIFSLSLLALSPLSLSFALSLPRPSLPPSLPPSLSGLLACARSLFLSLSLVCSLSRSFSCSLSLPLSLHCSSAVCMCACLDAPVCIYKCMHACVHVGVCMCVCMYMHTSVV
jgi:hypothetical protein